MRQTARNGMVDVRNRWKTVTACPAQVASLSDQTRPFTLTTRV
ncbi:hypothetical protein [Komagataeibacter swingsii]|nr:hypothetical protein [Komagataeibacter swingsii]